MSGTSAKKVPLFRGRGDNMKLREYQKDAISNIRTSLQSHKSMVYCIGCGAGKSVIAGSIAKLTTDKNNSVLFLVHRSELCEQIRDTFYNTCEVNKDLCSIGMIQTVRKHLKEIPEPKLIIVDEAHMFNGAYEKVFEAFPNAYKVGFTATPCRLGQGGLGNLFEDLKEGVSTKWLIENKFLAEYKYYSLPIVDTSGLHVKAGEFIPEEVNALVENKAVYSGAVDQYIRLTPDKKAMVYCSSIKASKEVIEEFQSRGIPAAHVDGTTAKEERERIVLEYRKGNIKVISNVDLFGVGFDDKDIEVTILLRPTLSLALYVQMSMRSLRYKENKTAVILDCCGNVARHGLPDDKREWTLETKKKQQNMIKIRECEKCYGVYPPTLDKCPYCGYQATKEIQKKNKKSVTVDLVEVRRTEEIKAKKYNEYRECKTFEELKEFQKAKGYKIQWAVRKCLELGLELPNKYYFMRKKMNL